MRIMNNKALIKKFDLDFDEEADPYHIDDTYYNLSGGNDHNHNFIYNNISDKTIAENTERIFNKIIKYNKNTPLDIDICIAHWMGFRNMYNCDTHLCISLLNYDPNKYKEIEEYFKNMTQNIYNNSINKLRKTYLDFINNTFKTDKDKYRHYTRYLECKMKCIDVRKESEILTNFIINSNNTNNLTLYRGEIRLDPIDFKKYNYLYYDNIQPWTTDKSIALEFSTREGRNGTKYLYCLNVPKYFKGIAHISDMYKPIRVKDEIEIIEDSKKIIAVDPFNNSTEIVEISNNWDEYLIKPITYKIINVNLINDIYNINLKIDEI